MKIFILGVAQFFAFPGKPHGNRIVDAGLLHCGHQIAVVNKFCLIAAIEAPKLPVSQIPVPVEPDIVAENMSVGVNYHIGMPVLRFARAGRALRMRATKSNDR